MRFSPDDAVFRVRLNLQQVSCAAEALRAWLPLVSQLRPVAMEFEAAHPDGLCRGFLADLLVVPPPLTSEAAVGEGTAPDRLLPP